MSSIESKGQIPTEELERIKENANTEAQKWCASGIEDWLEGFEVGAQAEWLRARSSQPTGQLLSELKEYRAFLRSIRTAANIGVIRHEARQLIERYPEPPLQPTGQLSPEEQDEIKSSLDLIAKERYEQIHKHGRTLKSDRKINANGELCWAASMLLYTPDQESSMELLGGTALANWDQDILKRMNAKPYKERLIIAGALIAAEIDRLGPDESPLQPIKEPVVEMEKTIPKMSDQLAAESDVAALDYGKENAQMIGDYDISADLTNAHEAGQTWMYRKLSSPPSIQQEKEHIHVQLPSGGVVNASPDASPELLNALDKMVELAKEAVSDRRIQQEAIPEDFHTGSKGKEGRIYPIGGYAPGNYMCKCCNCGKNFMGDKRAVQCEPCAESQFKETRAIPDQPSIQDILNHNPDKTFPPSEYEQKYGSSGEIELKSTVELPGGEISRTLEELYKAVPQPWRDRILRCTGVGTALQPLLEYVARFAESRTLTTNTQDK